ncbi:MAG: alpha/beta hydrolase [Chitinophagaceae bacterium]|nr:MAG: alpha/beta hydrolase [Chitinophagaceae bacterium]
MRLFVLVCITVMCSGCFSSFVMTEREIKNHYKNKAVKPTYFTITNDSVSLFCATTGADTLPPLLLVHGAPGAWYGSRNLLDDTTVQKQYHIITMDRLGYNKSKFKGRRGPVTSIETQAIAIHEALRLNHSNKTGVVMGSSFGGPIAAKLAIMYPERFHQLVMLAPAIEPEAEKYWWFHLFIRGGVVRALMPRFVNNATDEKMAHVEELKKLLPEWNKLSIPVTMVQGGEDNVVYPSNLDFLKKRLIGKPAEFVFLPGSGHMIRTQNPDLVRTIVLKARKFSKFRIFKSGRKADREPEILKL